MKDFFLVLDFDGTISTQDVTDAVLEKFAPPAWLEIEDRWVKGLIGSQQCLEQQMALINTTMSDILLFVSRIGIDPGYPAFVNRLLDSGQQAAIISDGFDVFIKKILDSYDANRLQIYANSLKVENNRLKTAFANKTEGCSAGTCKCSLAAKLCGGLPVVLVGDGRSDFCLAAKADHVFAKGKLIDYCQENSLPHTPFSCFDDLTVKLYGFKPSPYSKSHNKPA